MIIDPVLAKVIGLNESIVLQQLHYWLEKNENDKRNHRDGFYWTYNSFEKWKEQFPFWSVRTIKRLIASLEKQNFVITGNYNRLKIDRTKWYRLNYEKIETLKSTPLCQDVTMESDNITPPLPETIYSEINKGFKEGNFPEENSSLLSFNEFLNQYQIDKEKERAIRYFVSTIKERLGVEQKKIELTKWIDMVDEMFIFHDDHGEIQDLDYNSIVYMTDHYCIKWKEGKYKAKRPCITHFNSPTVKKILFYESAYY